ncbi:MAG: hypothetical protein WBZ36_15665 [Candidatus Nitrosopolaris sp.]
MIGSLTATVNKHIRNEVNKEIIDKLDIPVGLKELLVPNINSCNYKSV